MMYNELFDALIQKGALEEAKHWFQQFVIEKRSSTRPVHWKLYLRVLILPFFIDRL